MLKHAFLMTLLLMFSTSVLGEDKDPDPWKAYNLKAHAFNEFFDRTLLKPLAEGYKKIMPEFADKGVSNFYDNLGEPLTFVNDLLQAKPKAALVDLGRFGVNTTVGVLGFFDIATKLGWQRNDEDLGQTLGKWGVPSGPYFVIPLLGPSTLRDAGARIPEFTTNLNPVQWTDPHIDLVIGSIVLNSVDSRADLLASEKMLFGDRYTALRDFYLQIREFDVKDGDVDDDFLDEDDDW